MDIYMNLMDVIPAIPDVNQAAVLVVDAVVINYLFRIIAFLTRRDNSSGLNGFVI